MTNLLLNFKEFLLDNNIIFYFALAGVLCIILLLTILMKKQVIYLKEFKTINVEAETLKNLFSNTIISIIIVTLFAFAIGYRFNIVTSGSMRPSIEPGAVILVKKVPFENLEVGDVITFAYTSDQVTHQIIAINRNGFQLGEEITYKFNGEEYTFVIGQESVGKTIITHGTANSIESIDGAITYENVRGKVFYCIWYVGLVIFTIKTQIFEFMIMVIALFVGVYSYIKTPTYKFE